MIELPERHFQLICHPTHTSDIYPVHWNNCCSFYSLLSMVMCKSNLLLLLSWDYIYTQ